jgi:hypothetical protein
LLQIKFNGDVTLIFGLSCSGTRLLLYSLYVYFALR